MVWPAGRGAGGRQNEQVIADALWGLIEEGRLSIRRGGYVIRRGRGRVIVEARES